ncbi:MAG TPA: sulfotransferase domain-containing protein, partial [Mycobacteriales bacterium]|nr:sulfotransferase domain-containing protein [Mycobacteriales bacterium]
PPPADPKERFRQWAYGDTGAMGPSLRDILHHLQTFWTRREEPNVALFHYNDLLEDLPGELRRLADVLAIGLSDARENEFAAASTFQRMKQRADDLAPEVGNHIWRDTREFFHRGCSGQWRELLDAEDVRRYRDRVAELVPPDLAAWAHLGRRTSGDSGEELLDAPQGRPGRSPLG